MMSNPWLARENQRTGDPLRFLRGLGDEARRIDPPGAAQERTGGMAGANTGLWVSHLRDFPMRAVC